MSGLFHSILIMFTNNKGVALISVLLIVLMLSAISVSVGKYYFLSFKREGYVDFQSNAIQYLGNIETLALKEVKREFELSNEFTAKDNVLFANPLKVEIEKGLLSAELSDASNCFNINALYDHADKKYLLNERSLNGFIKLLSLLEYEENGIASLTDQILDWIDPDNQPRANGLEDYFYIGPMNTRKQYTSKRFFYDLSEIRNLPASSYFNWNTLKEHVCVFPNLGGYTINLNQLEPKDSILLASILPNLNIDEAESIINQIPNDGFKTARELYNAFPGIDFNKSYLPVSLKTDLLLVRSYVHFDENTASSIILINYKNNKATILSRFYNGI